MSSSDAPAAARRGRRAEAFAMLCAPPALSKMARSPKRTFEVKRVANSPRSIAWMDDSSP
jgi:hypothetical protein